MELRASESVSIESSTGFEPILLKCAKLNSAAAQETTEVVQEEDQARPGAQLPTFIQLKPEQFQSEPFFFKNQNSAANPGDNEPTPDFVCGMSRCHCHCCCVGRDA